MADFNCGGKQQNILTIFMMFQKRKNFSLSSEITLSNLHRKPEVFWKKRGDMATLRLYRQMVARVPAYRDFIKQYKIDPSSVKSVEDLYNLPKVDKDNYLRANELDSLCWDGKFKEGSWVISSTSGSTGEPFYFPRQAAQDAQYALTAELYFVNNFQIDKKSTLYIIAFPMGVWIGGVFTYEAATTVARRTGYPLSVITTGISVDAVLKAVLKLGRKFDQVIIGAYAPFLKDIIDQGIAQGINWADYNLKFIYSAEAFSEEFRQYIYRKTGVKDYYTASLNHYGTVDMGTMAHETPLSILIRREAVANPALYQSIFGQTAKQPTLCQYIPELFNFHDENGRLSCSSNSGLPLVQYDLKDNGGVIGFEEMKEIFKVHKLDLVAMAKKAGIYKTVWQLPYVYVYERDDFSVSFFAFQIYPETVRRALQVPTLDEHVSGKFLLEVVYNSDFDQVLQVHVELMPGVNISTGLELKVVEAIFNQLMQDSSEYSKTYEEYKDKVKPKVVFWTHGDEKYFKVGIKQRWVQKGASPHV